MMVTNERTITVFGGTGFLGRRIVRHLRDYRFSIRIASRHPDRGASVFAFDDPHLQSVEANIHDERSVADAVVGAYGVVNAVSLYVEHGQETEPPRVCRRLFRLSHAASFCSLSIA
ncbi:SDR family oxidoreductase [Nitrobacter sp. TKz-YC02]|uniref:SDR family oxidoreductase n=1 Tax=Nitrobacter sp. TKz-YC02 TaxID=3398704 RepID=UPI003CEE0568